MHLKRRIGSFVPGLYWGRSPSLTKKNTPPRPRSQRADSQLESCLPIAIINRGTTGTSIFRLVARNAHAGVLCEKMIEKFNRPT